MRNNTEFRHILLVVEGLGKYIYDSVDMLHVKLRVIGSMSGFGLF